jgi:hypothetical protein
MKKALLIFLNYIKRLKLFFLIVLAFWGGYEAHNSKIFPIKRFIETKLGIDSTTQAQDSNKLPPITKINYYSNISDRLIVKCPKTENALVIIGFGQSNSANHTGHRFNSEDNSIINFFDGKCYQAKDPMIGATGSQGSIWIPLAKKIKKKNGKKIVIASFGVGGTSIQQWLEDQELTDFYNFNLFMLKKTYSNPDMAFWIQGENEINTDPDDLRNYYNKFFSQFLSKFPKTNLYVTGTSYCNGKKNKNVIKIQKETAKKTGAIYVGETDSLVGSKFRYDDCHYSEKGVDELTNMLARKYNDNR